MFSAGSQFPTDFVSRTKRDSTQTMDHPGTESTSQRPALLLTMVIETIFSRMTSRFGVDDTMRQESRSPTLCETCDGECCWYSSHVTTTFFID